jgi:hypothetical protein
VLVSIVLRGLLLADLEHIARQFLAGTIPFEEWTHQAHLAVGTWHVSRYGAEEGLARLRVGIQSLNEKHGTPNSLTRGYHETITRAYVQLLAEFLESCPPDMSLQEQVERLMESPMADKNLLFQFYSRETLMSARAKSEWVEPDIAPLNLVNVLGKQGEA